MRVIITGGHHTSALPVIDELKKLGVEIFWIGHKYPPPEYREITELGIPFYALKAGKVYRNFNLLKWLRVPLGFLSALQLVLKLKPDVILSFGGYLAAPVVFAGWLVGVPSITHEQTVVAGYANKFISLFTKKILISWKQSARYYPKNKVVMSGLPLRKAVFEVRTDNFSINNDMPTIYITAGKTGSRSVNKAVLESMDEILDLANVIHQTGEHSGFNDFDMLTKRGRELGDKPGKYFASRYFGKDEIGEVLHKANLVVGRAGAHTIAEIVSLRKPALLIPIPWVSHDEQYKNAVVVRDYGLAEILEERFLNRNSLVERAKYMLDNISKYKPTSDSSPEGFIDDDAVKIICDEVFAAAKANK